MAIHPYFWSDLRILQFLKDCSDKLEFADPLDSLVLFLSPYLHLSDDQVVVFEQPAARIIGSDWTQRLHPELLLDLNRYRRYDVTKMRSSFFLSLSLSLFPSSVMMLILAGISFVLFETKLIISEICRSLCSRSALPSHRRSLMIP